MADVAREPRVGRATGLEPQLVEVEVWGVGVGVGGGRFLRDIIMQLFN